jgi:hypothetical protein
MTSKVFRKALPQILSLVSALSLTASAGDVRRPILVLVQPRRTSFHLGRDVVVKVLITNQSKRQLWFTSCPDPYTAELTYPQGRPAPHDPPPSGPIYTPVCGSNLLYRILPGKTWNTEIAIDQNFDLTVGTYSVRLLWHFRNFRKTDPSSARDFDVSSNTARLTMTK